MNSSPSSSLSKSQHISNKIIENQRLGFHLADEIRNLREDLLSSKQEKRLMLVNNQNLQEQLTKAENRIKQLEDTIEINHTAIRRLEKINAEEASHYMLLQEKLTALQSEHWQHEQQFNSSAQQLSQMMKSNKLMTEDMKKLRNYADSLESAVEELSTVNDQKNHEIVELKRHISSLESRLQNIDRRESVLAGNILDAVDSLGVSMSRIVMPPPSHVDPDEGCCSLKLESAVNELR